VLTVAVTLQLSVWGVAICETIVLAAHRFPYLFTAPILRTLLSYVNMQSASRININATFMLGWILTTIGTAIRVASYRELGRFFTFDLSIRKEHKLVTSGPYSYVRHPSYTGLILAFAGIAICLLREGSWARASGALDTSLGHYIERLLFGFVLFVPVNVGRRTYREDGMMKAEFRGQWEEWAKNVPYKLFPGVF